MNWIQEMINQYPTYRLLGEATAIDPNLLYGLFNKERKVWNDEEEQAWFKLTVLFS